MKSNRAKVNEKQRTAPVAQSKLSNGTPTFSPRHPDRPSLSRLILPPPTTTLRENYTRAKPTLAGMYAVDLQVQCKVVSAYEFPLNNSSDNDLTKLGSKLVAGWRERRSELAYGGTGPSIPGAWSGRVWKCRMSAFMLTQSNAAGTLESSRIISKIVGCVERFWLSARQKLELCENGHPQKHPKMSKSHNTRKDSLRSWRKSGEQNTAYIVQKAEISEAIIREITSAVVKCEANFSLSRFGRMHKPHAVAYATAYEVAGGTSRELGTRIEWRSWLGPEEKSSRVWAISSFIHLLFRCQGQPFKNGQRQLNLIGIADWQLPTGNTCIVNC
ncbi:hypothetical protein T01_7954 [Trichinella spiralis]|uniref:Uncharacterized protein n=1 Tax=Trichinella spiralis TaxID=6334 RepID=A0A0V1ATQ7_TRISP|nr:hypothetical protein T01_7954 [Trichinella spiralis]